jgi:hypothetical protein
MNSATAMPSTYDRFIRGSPAVLLLLRWFDGGDPIYCTAGLPNARVCTFAVDAGQTQQHGRGESVSPLWLYVDH